MIPTFASRNAALLCIPQVPNNVSDAAAVFAEPLAAACRIVEQDLVPTEANAAVLGDGKLGLLVSEVLARRAAATGKPWTTRAGFAI